MTKSKTHSGNNALVQVFRAEAPPLLNIFFTAGYPAIDDTARIVNSLQHAGVDMIEIGMPFSDPLADGPVISAANMKALENGMTIGVMFDQLNNIDFKVPVILMGYFNPVLQYGIERFCKRCSEAGVSGVIIPDLPLDLYSLKYAEMFERHGLCNVGMVTPATAKDRVAMIDNQSTGFIYAVSSASTTGTKSQLADVDQYLEGLSQMSLRNPLMTGFNIKDNESFERASRHTSGGIIGSAFLKAIADQTDLESAIHSFIKTIRP